MSMKLTREIRVIFSITLALMFIVICIWGMGKKQYCQCRRN